ncbi:hypothetical protein J6590_004110 [Homalodisca vitripennis]|nr:hypothetical protein J6590_004110 [Homalodisca vitripennis]
MKIFLGARERDCLMMNHHTNDARHLQVMCNVSLSFVTGLLWRGHWSTSPSVRYIPAVASVAYLEGALLMNYSEQSVWSTTRFVVTGRFCNHLQRCGMFRSYIALQAS